MSAAMYTNNIIQSAIGVLLSFLHFLHLNMYVYTVHQSRDNTRCTYVDKEEMMVNSLVVFSWS